MGFQASRVLSCRLVHLGLRSLKFWFIVSICVKILDLSELGEQKIYQASKCEIVVKDEIFSDVCSTYFALEVI